MSARTAPATAAYASGCGSGVMADGTRTPMRRRPGSFPSTEEYGADGRLGWYGPHGSPPAITSSSAALSRTVRVTTPCTAAPCIISPAPGPSGVSPRPGLRPTRPQHAAGMRVEPPPSLAPAAGTMPAATAAAEPPDDPPGVRVRSHGLRAGPQASGSLMALAPNSGRLVLPKIARPASSQRWTTVECSAAGTDCNDRDPLEVGRPA